MDLDSIFSYLMGLIFDAKYEEKSVDLKAEKLWKRWHWFKSLHVADSLNFLEDIEKMLIGMLADILDLNDLEMARIYETKFQRR